MMKIATLPVYSKLADDNMLDEDELRGRLPQGWHLSQHQVDTYRALNDARTDVIFNTAMTGDGKSLAAYLPVLLQPGFRAFGMYPTIELSRDQERQFQGYSRDFAQSLRYDALWGARLGQLAKESNFKRRGELLKERFNTYDVLLTNPDIFNLVMNYRYGANIFSDQELPYSLTVNFNAFIFDEFHIFGMPQIVAATTAMLYFQEQAGPGQVKFLFSSATPDSILEEMVERAGLRWQRISGAYSDTTQPGFRQVLYPTTLHIIQLAERQSAEAWLRDNTALIVNHWQTADGPRPRGAIIVNSVAAARRIVVFLKQALAPHHITVGENTGLTDEERRRQAMEDCDLVVGTSTIDVGVDFTISFLVFESLDAGTFLQRFGRLARVKRGQIPFSHYEAHALISGRTPWIHERLQTGLQAQGGEDGVAIDRPGKLREVVNNAFPRATQFQRYARRWGVLQAAHVLAVLDHNRGRDSHEHAYDSLVEALRDRYTRLFGLKSFGAATGHYWSLAGKKSDKQQENDGRRILDEVLSFRGTSPFQVGVWDATVEPPAFLAYDGFRLVQEAIFSIVDADEFKAALESMARTESERAALQERLKYVMQGKGERPLLLRVAEFLPESERLKLKVGDDLGLFADRVAVLVGLGVAEPQTSLALGDFNDTLRRQQVVTYVTRFEPAELRRKLKLPPLFPLVRAVDMRRNREWTLAFGKEALLLEAEAMFLRQKDEENEPIIL